MTPKQSKTLKVGDRVSFPATTKGDPRVLGTVVEIGYNCVKTKWDDGIIGHIHHNDATAVERVRQ